MASPVHPSCFAVPGSSSSFESELVPGPTPSAATARSRGTGRHAAADDTFRGGSTAAAATGGGPVGHATDAPTDDVHVRDYI
jgi:hypothetical protein